MSENYSRRKFIQRSTAYSSSFFGAVFLLAGCGTDTKTPAKETDAVAPAPTEPCKDFTGVPEEELDKRKKMGYVEQSALPESSCKNCGLYVPFSAESECGKCLLFKGPVFAVGHCVQWVAKTT